MSEDAASEDAPGHLQRLNPQQYRAVTTLDGPLLILAGAGSGKTRVLTRRVAHLLHTGVDPEAILAVTFTNKAASEMKERVIELVGEVGEKVWVSTFHSTCGRILRQDIEALGWTRRFAIYDDDDQLRIVRQLLADRGWDPKQFPPSRFLSKIDNYKNRLFTPTDVLAQRRTSPGDPVLQLWQDYEENLRAADAIDFNDLIGLVVRLFEESEEARESWQEKFNYVLVDEYQDTNHAQYKVLRTLAERHGNLCCVGDDDQSIYGFRGADIRNILDFQRDYPDALVVRMEQNYRCSKNILTVANAVVARNTGRIEKALWTQAHKGPLVNVLVAETPQQEAQLVATAIKQLVSQGDFAHEDMVILYRSNRTARTFERALARAAIPHEVIGGQSFYQRREIRDALAYLRLIVNPADDAAFLRVCNVPARGIGTKTLTDLRKEAENRGQPLLATARAQAQGSTRSAKALAGFVKLIDQLSSLARDRMAAALVREMLDRSGYDEMLREEDTSESRERLRNLDELVSRAGQARAEEGQNPLDALQAWLDGIVLTATGEEEEPVGKVSLMTVHTSKGLEFPVVFVVHMMEGTFPHARSIEDKGVEEERRLAYVAFTRAQKRLVVTRSNRLPKGEGKPGEPAMPSRFLFGLPEEATVGQIPETGEAVEEDNAARLGAHRARVARFLRRRKALSVDAEAVETRDVGSLSDLQPGTRVLHPSYGVGVVRMLAKTPHPPRAKVTFAGNRTLTVPLDPCPLRVVVPPQPTT